MAIANSKEVAVGRLVEIWVQNERVLVYFVGVVRNKPYSGSECVLSDDVTLDVEGFTRVSLCLLLLNC